MFNKNGSIIIRYTNNTRTPLYNNIPTLLYYLAPNAWAYCYPIPLFKPVYTAYIDAFTKVSPSLEI